MRRFRQFSDADVMLAGRDGKNHERTGFLKVEVVRLSYEAVVSKNGKKSEVAVEADGTIKK